MSRSDRQAISLSTSKKPRRPNLYNSSACDQCFRRKVRCDSERPACGRCSASGASCTYSFAKPTSSRTNSSTSMSSMGESVSSGQSPHCAKNPSLYSLHTGDTRDATQPYERPPGQLNETAETRIQQRPDGSDPMKMISVDLSHDLFWLDTDTLKGTQLSYWNYPHDQFLERQDDVTSTMAPLPNISSPSWTIRDQPKPSAPLDPLPMENPMPTPRCFAAPEAFDPSTLSTAHRPSASTVYKWSTDIISRLDDLHLRTHHSPVDEVITHTQQALDMVRNCVKERFESRTPASDLTETHFPWSTVADVLGCIMIVKQVLACYLALQTESSSHPSAGVNVRQEGQHLLSESDPDGTSARILSVVVEWGLRQCRDLTAQIDAWSIGLGSEAVSSVMPFMKSLCTAVQAHVE